MTEIQLLNQQIAKAQRKKKFVELTQLLAKLKQLEAEQRAEAVGTVRDITKKFTKEDWEKAILLCNKVMIYADFLTSASVELDSVLQKYDPRLRTVLSTDVRAIKKHSESIVRNVDEVGTLPGEKQISQEAQQRISDNFGDMCDELKPAVDNLIYTYLQRKLRE